MPEWRAGGAKLRQNGISPWACGRTKVFLGRILTRSSRGPGRAVCAGCAASVRESPQGLSDNVDKVVGCPHWQWGVGQGEDACDTCGGEASAISVKACRHSRRARVPARRPSRVANIFDPSQAADASCRGRTGRRRAAAVHGEEGQRRTCGCSGGRGGAPVAAPVMNRRLAACRRALLRVLSASTPVPLVNEGPEQAQRVVVMGGGDG